MADARLINVGEISGVFGVKGWVKVFSFTDSRANIVDYSPWLLKKGEKKQIVKVMDGGLQGRSVVVKLDGIDNRDSAAELMGWQIFVTAEQLPKPGKDEYYWADLVGLTVETVSGETLGTVDHLLETGANDVLIVKGERERAIPFLLGSVVIHIDLDAGKIVVDWDADF